MTDRKPPGVGWQSWVDRQIEQGRADGLFDDLPGTGRPLAGLDRRDELWWVRDKLRREEVQYLPETLQVRKDRDEARRQIEAATDEAAVLAVLERINARIRWVNSHVVDGPPSTVMPLDVDEAVAAWRAARPEPVAEPGADPDEGPAPQPTPGERRRRWSRRDR